MKCFVALLFLVATCHAQYALFPPNLPTPPPGAQTFTNINLISKSFTGGGAWTPDVTDAGGGAGTCTVANVSSPSLSGNAVQLSLSSTSGSSPANCLMYRAIGCPTLAGACAPIGNLNVLEDYYVYIPAADTGVQAVENDPDLYDSAYEYFNSRQADSASGMWRMWNMSSGAWITTSYPCMATFLSLTGTWHHVREYTIFDRVNSKSTYGAFELDGVTVWSGLRSSFPPKTNTHSATINVEFQLDLNSSAGTATQTLLLDNVNLYVWLG